MTNTPPSPAAATPEPFRYVDEDDFCLSARRLPDLDTGSVTDTLSITVEGDSDPQGAHVQVGEVTAVVGRAADPARPANSAPCGQTVRGHGPHRYMLGRHVYQCPGGAEPGRERCGSCDHETKFHDVDGRCWFTVQHGVPGSNLVCPCAPARQTDDGDVS